MRARLKEISRNNKSNKIFEVRKQDIKDEVNKQRKKK